MAETETGDPRTERPELLVFCGLLGLIGPLAITLGVLAVQSIAPGHDPIRHTISDLARGDTALIMDTIFYIDAAAMLALAIGAAHLHLGDWDWSLGIFALSLLALAITLLGIWDEFNGGGSEELSVHSRIAMALFPLYLVGPLSMARGIGRASRAHRRLFLAGAVLWPITALIYHYGPEAYEGLTERIAGATTMLWTLPLGHVLLRRGLHRV